MNKNYKKVLKDCANIIEQDYAPCGLEDDIRKRLLELTLEWEKHKENAKKEGKMIGGLGVIFKDVYRAVNQAETNEKRFRKPKCYYLRRGLQIPPSKRSGLGHWSLSMWG